jgi:hypothetical protein
VTAYAICVSTKPAGYQVVTERSAAESSEDAKAVRAECPDGTRLLSSGAAVTKTAPGNVSLASVRVGYFDRTNPRYTWARAVENTDTPASWDFIVATAICAS